MTDEKVSPAQLARIQKALSTVPFAELIGLELDEVGHGTATLAFTVSRVMNSLKMKPRRIRCRFAGMVLMPSTLTVHASRVGDEVAFETRNAQGKSVIERGWVE